MTNELMGTALEYAVALALGKDCNHPFTPATNWAQGGPIIELEGLELICNLTATEAIILG